MNTQPLPEQEIHHTQPPAPPAPPSDPTGGLLKICVEKLPGLLGFLLPMVLTLAAGILGTYIAIHTGMRDAAAQIKRLEDADLTFEKYLRERREVRDKQIDEVRADVKVLGDKVMTKELFDRYQEINKREAEAQRVRDEALLSELQRIRLSAR